MSSENEFAQYSIEKLTRMAGQFKKRQQIIMGIGVAAAIVIAVMAIASGNSGMYPVAGLLIPHQIDRTPQPATPALSYSGSIPSPLSMNTNQPLRNAIHGTNTRQVSISTPQQSMERTQQGNTITLRRAKHYKPRGSQ